MRCRFDGAEVSTGRHRIVGQFTIGSQVTAWLDNLPDMRDMYELEVFLEPAPASTPAESEWLLDTISVMKGPGAQRFDTFFCQQCASLATSSGASIRVVELLFVA